MNVKYLNLGITASALIISTTLLAADRPATNANKKMMTSAARRNTWKAETISGKIIDVDPNHHLVVVEAPGGVPFDMIVTAKTRIKSGDQGITLKDLTRDLNRTVSVTFMPERRGDVAKSMQISG